MPFTPTSPASQQVTETTVTTPTKSLNTYRLHGFNFSYGTPGNITTLQVKIAWSEGYLDGSEYIPVNNRAALIGDPALTTAMQVAVTDTNTRDNELEEMLWAILQTELDPSGNPWVPAGTVS
jgi:hypothetical protein